MPHEARRLDVSVPWLSAAGARKSLELLVSLGNDRIAEHNLGLARSLTEKLGLPEPESPIVRFRVADAEGAAANLQAAGIACAVGRGRSASPSTSTTTRTTSSSQPQPSGPSSGVPA